MVRVYHYVACGVVTMSPSPPSRSWQIVAPVAGYPASVPLQSRHFDGAWDYSGPTWDGTDQQKAGGVFATFTANGAQTYRGSGHPVYQLV